MFARSLTLLTFTLLLTACAPSRPSSFQATADWVQIDANRQFSFWIPATLKKTQTQGFDSDVGMWANSDMTVAFDYGGYSGEVDSTIKERLHTQTPDDASGRQGTIVTYIENNGDHFTGLFVPVGRGASGLTFTVSSKATVGADIPLMIVKSIRFPYLT